MATSSQRLAENVPGPFYVTNECIDCGLCSEIGPTIFQRHADIGFSVVFQQPQNESEQKVAREALEGCPCDAIGHELGNAEAN